MEVGIDYSKKVGGALPISLPLRRDRNDDHSKVGADHDSPYFGFPQGHNVSFLHKMGFRRYTRAFVFPVFHLILSRAQVSNKYYC